MNTIENGAVLEKPVTALTVVERAQLALGSKQYEIDLRELVKESAELTTITNPDGREQVHAARMKLVRARTGLEKSGKDARDDAVKFSKSVLDEEKRLLTITGPEEKRLTAIQTVWDTAIEAERAAKAEVERQKVLAIQQRIADIRANIPEAAGKHSQWMRDTIIDLVQMEIGEDFGMLESDAEEARSEVINALRSMETAALASEAAAAKMAEQLAELERLRIEDAQRKAAERVEQERADREAAERRATESAAHTARLKQEEDEARARREEADRVAAAARAEEDARAQAQRDEIARAQAALDAEKRQREEAEATRKATEEEERRRVAASEEATRAALREQERIAMQRMADAAQPMAIALRALLAEEQPLGRNRASYVAGVAALARAGIALELEAQS